MMMAGDVKTVQNSIGVDGTIFHGFDTIHVVHNHGHVHGHVGCLTAVIMVESVVDVDYGENSEIMADRVEFFDSVGLIHPDE